MARGSPILREIFTREVFSLLLHKQLINLTLIQKILRWRHTGFHVHSQVRARSKQEAERVGKGLGWVGDKTDPLPQTAFL